ncbi:MAG: dienelactone hydrolase family protein [Devosia sp.]
MNVRLSGPLLPPKSAGPARQLMVLLHGYGADGADLIGLGYQWRDLFPDMMFVAPNAPSSCARSPSGFEWFPLLEDRISGRLKGAEEARPVIINFLIDLWAQTGLTARETVLCGFSQGAMMALNVGTSLDSELAGIIAFSGAMIPADGFAGGRWAKPPVALIHGDQDHVVEPRLSREAATELSMAGFEVVLHFSKGAGHGIAPDGLEFATGFLVGQVAGKP